MKKHDEGYVLVYVTVVLLVFCLVATTILTGALNNLRNQQNAIAKMEDQYAAAGEIEKVIAVLNGTAADKVFTCSETVEISWDETNNDDDDLANVLTITSRSGSVAVTCKLKLTGANLSVKKTVTEDADLGTQTTVTISGLTAYAYKSYEIGGGSE